MNDIYRRIDRSLNSNSLSRFGCILTERYDPKQLKYYDEKSDQMNIAQPDVMTRQPQDSSSRAG